MSAHVPSAFINSESVNACNPATMKFESSIKPTALAYDFKVLRNRALDLSAWFYESENYLPLHDTELADTRDIANELKAIGSTLHRLDNAIIMESTMLTDKFKGDLSHSNTELSLFLDEIKECLDELRKAKSSASGLVPWFFKKGRVSRLLRHLQVVTIQLSVLRVVLDGATNVKMTSPATQQPLYQDPCSFAEGRAILQAALSKNQDSVRALLEQERAIEAEFAASPQKIVDMNKIHQAWESPAERNAITEIGHLSTSSAGEEVVQRKITTVINRRFTKRIHEGTHSPLLDIGNSPAAVVKGWTHRDFNSLTLIAIPVIDDSDLEHNASYLPREQTLAGEAGVTDWLTSQPRLVCTHAHNPEWPEEEAEVVGRKTRSSLRELQKKVQHSPIGRIVSGLVRDLARHRLRASQIKSE